MHMSAPVISFFKGSIQKKRVYGAGLLAPVCDISYSSLLLREPESRERKV